MPIIVLNCRTEKWHNFWFENQKLQNIRDHCTCLHKYLHCFWYLQCKRNYVKVNYKKKWKVCCKNLRFAFSFFLQQNLQTFRWGRGPHSGTSGGHHPAVLDYRTGYIRSHLRSPSGRVRWLNNTHFQPPNQSIKRCLKPISWIHDLHENTPMYQLIDWTKV